MTKQNAKGQKQILEENKSTIFYYRAMTFVAVGVYTFALWLLFNTYSTTDKVLLWLSVALLLACNYFLAWMARPTEEDGQTVDVGCDLNMEGGLAEHVKDGIILVSASLLLSSISSYFWLLLLLGPVRAMQMLWSSVIGPYLSSSSAPEVTEEEQQILDKRAAKKARQRDLRMRRGW